MSNDFQLSLPSHCSIHLFKQNIKGLSLKSKQNVISKVDIEMFVVLLQGVPPITELYKGELHLSLMFEDRSLLVGKQKERLEREEQKSGKKKKNNKKPTSGKIFIHIKEGRDLPAADRDGFSDPFCKW